jgi:prepilin-type N-terminal cleavage/methylation domain-containing protein
LLFRKKCGIFTTDDYKNQFSTSNIKGKEIMKKNFTLIELLVVIAIIAILAGLVMPALGHAQARGRTTECINNKKQIMTVLRMYGNDHTSMIPYQISVANNVAKPYSWILGGLGGADYPNYAKEMVSKKVLVCNTANQKDLNGDGTNATGMIDVDFGTNSNDGWYENKKAAVGRFVAKDGARDADNVSVAYVLEKMKNPSDMLLLADSFLIDNNDQDTPFWTFTPLANQPKANGSTAIGHTNGTMIATPHVGSTVVAYADGRAGALTEAELSTSVLKVNGKDLYVFDSNMKQKKL